MTSTSDAGISKDSGLTIERRQSAMPGKLILRFSGPLTTRAMYLSMSPDAVRHILDYTALPGEGQTKMRVFDLADVPYMDSMGVGFLTTEYVRCRNRGVRLIAAGASPRVAEVLRLTRVDTMIPMAATVEEALRM